MDDSGEVTVPVLGSDPEFLLPTNATNVYKRNPVLKTSTPKNPDTPEDGFIIETSGPYAIIQATGSYKGLPMVRFDRIMRVFDSQTNEVNFVVTPSLSRRSAFIAEFRRLTAS